MGNLRIKAGKRACDIIKSGGLVFDSISTYFGPAVGPRWLIAAGFDLALLRGDSLARERIVTLAGASAGAWRFAAWMQPQPDLCYQKLINTYIDIDYSIDDTPASILSSLQGAVNEYLEDDALSFALANKKYRLAIITARARNLLAARAKWIQQVGMGLAFTANAISRSGIYLFAERVVFYNGPKPPAFCLKEDFQGTYVPLTEVNFKQAVLASGAIPLVVPGVDDIYGAPYGRYIDGGLIDYHLTHSFNNGPEDLTLFFHHQERIIPGWLDQRLTSRKPDEDILNNLVMVFPTDDFIKRLPDGKAPDRTDYVTQMGDPSTRKKNWRRAVEIADPLGDEFIELVLSGKLKQVVEPIC